MGTMSRYDKTARLKMIKNFRNYIVVNDGQCKYPVLRADLRDGDTEAAVASMSSEEYAEWCQAVPADQHLGSIGSEDLNTMCDLLTNLGTQIWHVG
jgi:hypothetical protein